MKDNVMGYETLSWIIDSSQKGFFAVTASPAMQRVILSHYNYSSILIFDYSKKKHPFDYSKLSKELSKKKNKDIRTCFIFNFQLAVDTEDDLIRLNHSRDMLAGENKNLVFFMDENTYRKINLEARDFFSYFQLKLEFEDEGVLPVGKEDFDFNYTGAQGTDTAEPIAIDFNKPKEELLARAIALSNRATALENNGEYAKAKAALEAVVKIRERLLGEEHPDTAASYNKIGVVYYKKGEYDHALEYNEKALAIFEKVLGKEHPHIAGSYNNIAEVYRAKGEYDRALEYHEKALAIREKVLGREHPDTAASYNNIANVYYVKGEYDRALEYHEKALAIDEKMLGKKNPSTAIDYNNIGGVYYAKGEYNYALEYNEKALAIREKVLGREHPSTAASYNNIALVYDAKGEYDRALEYHEKTLAIREKVLGKEHPDTALSCHNIGALFYKMGRLDDAAANLARALGTYVVHNMKKDAYDAIMLLATVYSAKGGDPSDGAAFFEWVDKLISSLD